MKVLKPGKTKKWSVKAKCTGAGNGNGGCGAELLVERDDLFKTQSHALNETTTYTTFKCPSCSTLTDLPDTKVPSGISAGLPSQKVWEENHTRTKPKPAATLKFVVNTHTLVYQEWEESERGWGVRPDGFSLHLSEETCAEYVKKANEEQHKFFVKNGLREGQVPDEYSRISGGPRRVSVPKLIYDQVEKSNGSYRSYSRQIRVDSRNTLVGFGPEGLKD